MKKVLIVPSNTDLNRGDQSLTWASIDLVNSIYKNNKVNIFLYENKNKQSAETNKQTSKLGYPFLTRILAHPGRNDTKKQVRFTILILLKWGTIAIYDLITTLLLLAPLKTLNYIGFLFLSEDKRKTYKKFHELDALFVKGGGFLHSYGSLVDPYVMYFQLFDVMLAQKLGIKTFILPNSVGPLKNRFARRIVINTFKKCNKIYVREGVSNKFLNENNISNFQSPDLGFYLAPSKRCFVNYLNELGVDLENKKNIAITLRPYRFDGKENADELYSSYISNITSVINYLLKSNVGVTLIAHTIGPSAHENDNIPLLEIYNDNKNKKGLTYLHDIKLDCRDLEKIYSYYDLVIGTRFHSVIFSLNVGTPCIAIAYGGNKATGIMKDMNLGVYVVPIEDPDSEKIINLIGSVFNNLEEYKMKIDTYKKTITKERKSLVLDLKNILNE
ncbi:MAG: polysaccharide pyruvyl transferase family protein [Flavobacteriaceae bacterium]|nr:polysaccharide pyruvyl transferase family protein [Flavobacteriaceae bacterium]